MTNVSCCRHVGTLNSIFFGDIHKRSPNHGQTYVESRKVLMVIMNRFLVCTVTLLCTLTIEAVADDAICPGIYGGRGTLAEDGREEVVDCRAEFVRFSGQKIQVRMDKRDKSLLELDLRSDRVEPDGRRVFEFGSMSSVSDPGYCGGFSRSDWNSLTVTVSADGVPVAFRREIGMTRFCNRPPSSESRSYDYRCPEAEPLRTVVAQGTVHCRSSDRARITCHVSSLHGVDRIRSVKLLKKSSRADCEEGSSFGAKFDDAYASVWVDRGCEGDFELVAERDP